MCHLKSSHCVSLSSISVELGDIKSLLFIRLQELYQEYNVIIEQASRSRTDL